mmetsp:Transcript_75589/g.211161  ORF Transcript_75589/g.211161 Transcript_75589/m.211161 type:complete len:456 (-) Transcript_75589:2-1369(-)
MSLPPGAAGGARRPGSRRHPRGGGHRARLPGQGRQRHLGHALEHEVVGHGLSVLLGGVPGLVVFLHDPGLRHPLGLLLLEGLLGSLHPLLEGLRSCCARRGALLQRCVAQRRLEHHCLGLLGDAVVRDPADGGVTRLRAPQRRLRRLEQGRLRHCRGGGGLQELRLRLGRQGGLLSGLVLGPRQHVRDAAPRVRGLLLHQGAQHGLQEGQDAVAIEVRGRLQRLLVPVLRHRLPLHRGLRALEHLLGVQRRLRGHRRGRGGQVWKLLGGGVGAARGVEGARGVEAGAAPEHGGHVALRRPDAEAQLHALAAAAGIRERHLDAVAPSGHEPSEPGRQLYGRYPRGALEAEDVQLEAAAASRAAGEPGAVAEGELLARLEPGLAARAAGGEREQAPVGHVLRVEHRHFHGTDGLPENVGAGRLEGEALSSRAQRRNQGRPARALVARRARRRRRRRR